MRSEIGKEKAVTKEEETFIPVELEVDFFGLLGACLEMRSLDTGFPLVISFKAFAFTTLCLEEEKGKHSP